MRFLCLMLLSCAAQPVTPAAPTPASPPSPSPPSPSPPPAPPPQTAQPTADADEYAVYAAILTQMRSDQPDLPPLYVVQRQTEPSRAKNARQRIQREPTRTKTGKRIIRLGGWETLDEAALDDFEARNQQSVTIENRFHLEPSRVELIDLAEIHDLFGENGSGWKGFYGKYPDAGGIVTFSRVGFSRDRTQAVVYVGVQSNWLAGYGQLVMLVRDGDKWRKDASQGLWIS